jgi:hypothetical protein
VSFNKKGLILAHGLEIQDQGDTSGYGILLTETKQVQGIP